MLESFPYSDRRFDWPPELCTLSMAADVKKKSRNLKLSSPRSTSTIPEGVRRPVAARQALRFRPLMKASWAHPARVERVPFVSARAEPSFFVAGPPTTQGPANPRLGRLCPFFFFRA